MICVCNAFSLKANHRDEGEARDGLAFWPGGANGNLSRWARLHAPAMALPVMRDQFEDDALDRT
jgi:hypothetical protein